MRFKRFKEDIDAFIARDPAARSRLEVALCYPGYHALLFYRLTNWLWKSNWRVLGRFISSIGRLITLIEIHPGAKIGRRFVIDHGSAIVVGETDSVFSFNFKVENIKVLPGTYEVVVSQKLLSRFTSKNHDLTYYIALEPDSTFG